MQIYQEGVRDMQSESQSLDQFIASQMTGAIASLGRGSSVTIAPAATWRLCATLADHGLARSEAGGVAAQQIGPFRLAVKGDGPANINTLIETMIPIAVSYAASGGPDSPAYYVAALSFAFHVLSATCASGCVIKNADEWDVLLFIKSQNQASPAKHPTIDDIKRHFSGISARSLPGAMVDAAIENLKAKRPIWGSSDVDLIKEAHGGGYVALA